MSLFFKVGGLRLDADRELLKSESLCYNHHWEKNGGGQIYAPIHNRGSKYTSEQFQRLMADHGAICSMSRSGNVWDNAAMEKLLLLAEDGTNGASVPKAARQKTGIK
jgi:transposase InsO family protein